ncbi:hypothetical protein ACFVWN_16995 [Nocardiopsis flavescens]|uniref:hypothetical protein n=1 Tax=Nocardiopsis flavescens TaxID=758803 RepID=UPI00365155F3
MTSHDPPAVLAQGRTAARPTIPLPLAACTVLAVPLSAWTLHAALGTVLAACYPPLLILLVLLRAGHGRAPGHRRLTALLALALAGAAWAAFASAGLHGLGPADRLGWAVLTVAFYLPAAVTATAPGTAAR